MEKPTVTKTSALSMQVCVPEVWEDEQAKTFADTENECGTQHGWQIRKEGSERLAGDPERRACADREGFVHIILDA